MVVRAALQEDAQVIGVSIHSGAHMTLLPKVMAVLDERQAKDIMVFAGGIIPAPDIAKLKRLGVAEVFTPGAPLEQIVGFVSERFPTVLS
jgi:methylmalonyl-CoA mutase C-terminal domain/subunit